MYFFFLWYPCHDWLVSSKLKAQLWGQEEWFAVSASFNGEWSRQVVSLWGAAGEEGGRGLKGRRQRDERGRREHVMRLLGFNQYGIWPGDDWKTNLIWEAIRLSFISAAVSTADPWGSYCHPLFFFFPEFSTRVHSDALNNADGQARSIAWNFQGDVFRQSEALTDRTVWEYWGLP